MPRFIRLLQVRSDFVMLGQIRFVFGQVRKGISGYDWLCHVRTC
jgi:hypothetical protein